MYTPQRPGRAEDYTIPSLVMIFVNLVWILGVIWVQFGLIAVVICGWVCNKLISRLEAYKRAVEYARRWPRTE